MGEVIILLGSNIRAAENIRLGAQKLASQLPIQKVSSVWITPAIGTTGPDFYNAAVKCISSFNADSLKMTILRPIEEQMGRIRTSDKYAHRTIDLDIIIMDETVHEPRLWDTAFVLLPVAELVPELRHPTTGKSLQHLSRQLQPSSGASCLSDFPLFE